MRSSGPLIDEIFLASTISNGCGGGGGGGPDNLVGILFTVIGRSAFMVSKGFLFRV